MEMPTGTIKKLVSDRGFGFIKAEDGQEYFFHRSGTEGDFDGLQGGEKVSFEIESSPKGPRAKSVRIAYVRQPVRGPGFGPGLFCLLFLSGASVVRGSFGPLSPSGRDQSAKRAFSAPSL